MGVHSGYTSTGRLTAWPIAWPSPFYGTYASTRPLCRYLPLLFRVGSRRAAVTVVVHDTG